MPKKKSTLSSLNEMMGKFTDTMGEGIIHRASVVPNCRKIKSSVPVYNYVTFGGFPIGRVIEHYGPQGSMKSYLAYDAIAQFQHYDWANHEQGAFKEFEYDMTQEGLVKPVVDYTLRRGYKPKKEPVSRRCALVDIEGTYTPDWGEHFGIDNDGLILIRPTFLSQAVDIIQSLLTDDEISLVVIDSLSAVGTDAEIDSSMENEQMASGAKFWNKAFRKIQAAMNQHPTKESTVIVINSAYSKVGMVFGDPEVLRNGEQLQRTKTNSIRFRALKEITAKTDEGDQVVGRNIAIKCTKCKVGTLGRSANFFFAFTDYGTSKKNFPDIASQIVDLGMTYNIVSRKGAWYDYKDAHVQGLDNFIQSLVESGLIKELENEVNDLIE